MLIELFKVIIFVCSGQKLSETRKLRLYYFSLVLNLCENFVSINVTIILFTTIRTNTNTNKHLNSNIFDLIYIESSN